MKVDVTLGCASEPTVAIGQEQLIDNEPPVVSITGPENNATVSGSVAIVATASDNIAVARVEFSVDGFAIGTCTEAPYNVAWNTLTVTDGFHTLLARVYDGGGLSAESSINVRVSNGQIVVKLVDSQGNPLAGGLVSYAGSAWISLGATDVNGEVKATVTPGSYIFRMTYGGLSKDIAQDVGANPLVLFQTVNTVIKLVDSAINPLAGGVVTYAGSSWQSIGTTDASGQTSRELLPGRYTFRMTYGGLSKDIAQDVGVNPLVLFKW